MRVEGLLSGGLAIGDEEVDAISAGGIGASECACQAAGDGEEVVGGRIS